MTRQDRRAESARIHARFPTRRVREEFLEQIRLWNRVEALPSVEAEALADGLRVRLSAARYAQLGLRRLIEAYGGWCPVNARAAATASWHIA